MRLETNRILLGVLALTVALTSCSKPNLEDHVRKADEYAEQSRFEEAVLEYRVALQADPNRGDVHLKLGDLYLRNRDAANATRETIRAADLLPNDVAVQIKAGNYLLLGREFLDAKTRATKILALDPKNVDAQILLGNALAGLRDFDAALSEYQGAIALDPTRDAVYANMAALQIVKGRGTEAEQSFRAAVDAAPKSIRARMALANLFWGTGRMQEAEQVLQAAFALDPADTVTNRALGVFYVATNRLAEAEPYFRTFAATARTTEATLALSDYYVSLNRAADARRLLTDLAKGAEAFAPATTRLAALDAVAGQRAEALIRLDSVLNAFPKDTTARLLKARVLLLDGKRDAALAEARTVAAESENGLEVAWAYAVVGRAEDALDHSQDAIAAYEEVLKRDPRPFTAALALSRLHLGTGNTEKAAAYAHQAIVIDPKSPVARSLVVRIELADNDVVRARRDLASLQKEFPNAPTVLNLTAGLQFADGQLDAARTTYARVLGIAPADFEAITGLVQIDLIQGRTKDAIARIESGLKGGVPSGDFLVLGARAYAAARDLAKTEELLKRAIELEPARLSAYVLLGDFYIRQDRLEDALTQYRGVVQMNPKSIPAQTMIAMLLEAKGQLPEAEAEYQKVLAGDATAAVAANNLAWIYVSSNRNLDKALELAQTAQRSLPDEPHVNDTLGWVYYRRNVPESAVRHLEMSVHKDATDPAVFYRLGMAYMLAREPTSARKALQRALALKRPFEGESDARKVLEKLGG